MKSRPARALWIEIKEDIMSNKSTGTSRPARALWIEIPLPQMPLRIW